MKKILSILMLSIISIISFGQVSVNKIQKEGEIVIKSVNDYIYKCCDSNDYYLIVSSDNQFEDKIVKIKLGNGSTESINSLKLILNLWENSNDGDIVDISGNRCYINKIQTHTITIQNPPYSAGKYYFTVHLLKKAIKLDKNGKF